MTKRWKMLAVTTAIAGFAVAVPLSPQTQSTAYAQVVTINGHYLNSGVQPISRNGRTLVAMRPIFEGLGADVQWDGANKRITAQTQNTEVVMQIGNAFAIVNGQAVSLDQAPLLFRGNTMVPLRFVSEALGANVDYNAAANSIGITTSDAAPQSIPQQQVSQQPYEAPQQQAPTPTEEPEQGDDRPNAQQGNGISINLAKRIYAPTEPIELNFTAPLDLNYNTRADLIPADVQAGQPALDKNLRLTYENLRGKQRGTLNFKAPKEEGQYLFRVNYENKQYVSIPFEVQAITPTVAPLFTMTKDVFTPGEPMEVNFEAPAFYNYNARLNLVAANIPVQDTIPNRLTYENIRSKTQGVLKFTAPKELGEYELRFDDSYGHVIPALSFTVQATSDDVQPTLAMRGRRFSKGSEIEVNFTAPAFYPYNARITLIPAEYKNESLEVIKPYIQTYQNLARKTRGTFKFKAPNQDGVYTFILDDNNGNIVAMTGDFTVGNAVAAPTNQEDDGNAQYTDDVYYEEDQGTGNHRGRNRAREVGEDVADDTADAVGSGIKEKVRKGIGKIFR